MKNNFLIYRTVGNYAHFLNCSSGIVQSFKLEDGQYIIENLTQPDKLKKILSKEIINFLFSKKKRMRPKELRASLLELGSKFKFPTTVNIELNRRCVLRCKHCYIPYQNLNNDEPELFDKYSLEDIKKLFISLKKIGVFLVVLTGGEPFLNKKFKNFLKEADRQGFIVEIFSNLQIIPSWFAENRLGLRINRFQTSIYSIVPEVHDLITGLKGSLKNTLKNLFFLKKKGYRIEVASPLMCFNFNSRIKTKKYFSNKHITQSFSWPIVNEYYDGCKGKQGLNIKKEQFLQFIDENPDFILQPNFTNKKNICGAGRLLFSISANGDIFPCSQFPKKMGNIKDEPLEKIVKNKSMCGVSCLSPNMINRKEYKYNFCMGNNYSETGDPLKVPGFLNKMYKNYEQHMLKKGGEKNK